MKTGVEAKIDKLLKQMTLDEKLTMIHGGSLFATGAVDRLDIPALVTSDGPMGVRKDFMPDKWEDKGWSNDYVTYLPCNSAVASTWNREVAHKSGEVLGAEARGRGKDVILAPGINMKRSPLCGRNFEYMTEDPYLAGEMAASMIKGIQKNDVAACVKHFAVNSQETDRLEVDEVVDERTLREIYLPAFKKAIKEGDSYTIMGAYNRLNKERCCESKYLLKQVLRDEWGYDGTVISDWGGVHDTHNSANVPLDIEMSIYPDFDEYFFANPLKKAIENNEVSEFAVDDKVRNVLRLMYRLKMLGSDAEKRKTGSYNTKEHQETVLEAARESIIVLKNTNQLLPLSKKVKKVAVIGQNANIAHAPGGGSGEIKALYEITPLMGISKVLGGNTEIKFVPGYDIPDKPEMDTVNWQAESLDKKEAQIKYDEMVAEYNEKVYEIMNGPLTERGKKYREEAIELAKECDQVIFVGGLNHDYDVEGGDRQNMNLPYHQDELIEELLKIRSDMVVVMFAGSPVEMSWAHKVQSLVWMYYSGMEGGTALAEVIYGDVNPSGKLAETLPVSYRVTPTGENGNFATTPKSEHTEGIYIGYRYYEKKGKRVEFPFGYGLSYTEFSYENPKVTLKEGKDDLTVTVKFDLRNVGSRLGKEAVQLYISDYESSVDRPVKELKEFAKYEIKAGGKKKVEFKLHKEAFGFYDVKKGCFVVEPGRFYIMIGTSSEKINIKEEINIANSYTYEG